VVALLIAEGGEEFEPRCAVEAPIVGHELHAKADCGGGDPSVAVVELVAEGVADLLAAQTKVGALGDHLVVGLHDGELRDAAFESTTPELAARNAPKRSSITVWNASGPAGSR
jgi:hypothetical protein